jgi:aspartyl aminopeptidase
LSNSLLQDFELTLFDTQPSAVGGLASEFVYSGRLDNLCMTYTTFSGLIQSLTGGSSGSGSSLESDTNVRIATAFDNEEVGSDSIMGAASTMLQDIVTRLCPTPSLLPAS